MMVTDSNQSRVVYRVVALNLKPRNSREREVLEAGGAWYSCKSGKIHRSNEYLPMYTRETTFTTLS